ncbi:MAG TPA: cation diffusion facilitator family transporter [Polyangiaceae bacterium]|nr:cation diffusion facilitator family transporter [Polyangiaceae bacterium]
MSEERTRGIRRVLLFTLLLNLLVASLKIGVGTLTHTLSVRADGFHSLTDGFSNVLGLIGMWWASRPPDTGHPYGHERVEVIAGSVVGAGLLLVAWNVVRGAIERLLASDVTPAPDATTWVVLLVTLAVNLFVVLYERHQAKTLNSSFLASDSAHTLSDVLVTLGVVVAVACIQLGQRWMDWLAAFVVAAFILVAGLRILSTNFHYLLDAAQIPAEAIDAVVRRVPGVASTHKIRTRGQPGAVRVDLHIQIAPHLNVVHAHEVTHWVIAALKREITGVIDVVVHTEPAAAGVPYPELPPRMSPIEGGPDY